MAANTGEDFSPVDPEKLTTTPNDIKSASRNKSIAPADPDSLTGNFAKWNAKIESLAGIEARGITRVLPHERDAPTSRNYAQMALIWFSANLTANNLALGLLGPLVYDLSFTDAALCAVFGAIIGSAGTAYMSIWGPQSGNRTLVCWRQGGMSNEKRN